MGMRLCVARPECVLGIRLCVAQLECVLVLRHIILWPGMHACNCTQSGSDLATQSLVPMLKVY